MDNVHWISYESNRMIQSIAIRRMIRLVVRVSYTSRVTRTSSPYNLKITFVNRSPSIGRFDSYIVI